MWGGGAIFFEDMINEVYYFGVGEIHIITSIVGGITTSQGVIKVNSKYNSELF